MEIKVIIVGAGPVGLLLGNLLGSKNIPTLILEKELIRQPWSKAMGISPPSLGILSKINIDSVIIENGLKGRRAYFNNNYIPLGSMRIANFPSKHPFIISLSQATTESLLEKNLAKYKSVKIMRGYNVTEVNEQNDSNVIVKGFNIENGNKFEFKAEIVCACDGENSIVRKSVGISFTGNIYKPTFIMGDFHDRTIFENDAHLWFTKDGSVESFPLPNKIRRWIIQTKDYMKNPKPGFLEKIIEKRTRIKLKLKDQKSLNPFSVKHFLAERYSKGRVFLCGDSAHLMSPIGGQGMNTGFADAEFLAYIISAYINNQKLNLNILAKRYEYYRKIAVKSAILRAHLGMGIGTAKGCILSIIRSLILAVLLHLPVKSILLPIYTMQNIPYNRLSKVLHKENIINEASSKP